MQERALEPAGARVTVTALGRKGTGWRPRPARGAITAGQPVAFRLTVVGGTVYCLVIAQEVGGARRVLSPRILQVGATDARTVGADGRFVALGGDAELLVVHSSDRQDLQLILDSAAAKLPAGPGTGVHRFAVRIGRTPGPDRPTLPPRPARRRTAVRTGGVLGPGFGSRHLKTQFDLPAGGRWPTKGAEIVRARASLLPRSPRARPPSAKPATATPMAAKPISGKPARAKPVPAMPARARPAKASPLPAAAAPSGRRRRTAKRPDPGPPPGWRAFGLLKAPPAVVAGDEFEVVVGLAEQAVPGTSGGPITVPDPATGPYALVILLVAEGCSLRDGEQWRNELPVSSESPYPTITLHLTSDEIAEGGVGARTIQAVYSVAGSSAGLAIRAIAVVPTKADLDQPVATPRKPTPTVIDVPAAADQPDLEIRILTDPTLPVGTLLWDVESKHPSVRQPDRPIAVSIGDEPENFANIFISDIEGEGDPETLFDTLRGYGRQIAEKIPSVVVDAITAAGKAVDGRPPSVLILSAEPYIPWELAVLEPPLDPGIPAFLGAQAAVGRWALRERRPAHPPPAQLAVQRFGVMTGTYAAPLDHADAEGRELVSNYAASRIQPDIADLRKAMTAKPAIDILHFAVHGTFDAFAAAPDGLLLTDSVTLRPKMVQGMDIPPSLVFMNACQVGSGNALLGSYSGMAMAFLVAGAIAVVGPLWKINDERAGEIARRFYQNVLSGVPVGEAIRRERAAYSTSAEQSQTLLAYQFFGHPLLRLDNKLTPGRP